MQNGLQERCIHHPRREAVARCALCNRFFCRECVTEHDARMTCVACLRASMATRARQRTRARTLALAVNAAIGLTIGWMTFFAVGKALLHLPTTFHEGFLWNTPFDASDED